MHDNRDRVALFLGSGFSSEFQLPTTRQLHESLLELPPGIEGGHPVVVRREKFISRMLATFWQKIFGWSEGLPKPALEDHFTEIDLAANSGHHLGPSFGPKELRAIRRMSIHRILKTLDKHPAAASHVHAFLRRMVERFDLSIVTTNWDIMVERCLDAQGTDFNYGSESRDLDGNRNPMTGVPVLKLHGSGNWGYCDCCRQLIILPLDLGKIAVNMTLFLEPDDFRLFPGGSKIARDLRASETRQCLLCTGRWGARLATFSYRKDFSGPVFQNSWEESRLRLWQATRWLFIGYSMPEADIEIRYLLKSTQLAQRDFNRQPIDVILKEDQAAGDRYLRFFGSKVRVFQSGLKEWITNHLGQFCRDSTGAIT